MNDPAVYSLFTSPEALCVKAEKICFDTGTLSLLEFISMFMEHILKVCQPKNFSYRLQAYYQTFFEIEREYISEEDLAVVKSGDVSAIYLKMSETETPSQALCTAHEAACRGIDVSKLV